MKTRSAFTLLEIMATLLLLAFGLVSVIGMVQYATRLSATAQGQSTALITGQTVMLDPQPMGLVADVGDANGDSWWADGNITAPQTGSYSFKVWGFINGYFVERLEESDAADSVGEGDHRWAWITVRIFSGDKPVTSIRRRLLRRTVQP